MTCVLPVLLGICGIGDRPSSEPCARALVALVDVSGSMGIEDKGQTRLGRAVSLIQDLARDNPPAPGRPLILITFNTQVLVHEHTELLTLEKQLESLRPGGGTSISSGLRAACKVAEQHVEATRLELLLVTDMEDSERESIAMEQDRLNRLFQKRGSEGKADGDSLVFVRTWAKNDASAQKLGDDLAGPIVKNGAGKTINLGKAEPKRLPLRASVRCLGTRWDDPRKSMIVNLEAETSLGDGPVPGAVTLLAPAGQTLSIPAGSRTCKGDIKLPVVGNSPPKIRLEIVVNRFQHTSEGLVIVDSPGHVEIEAPLPLAPMGISFSGKTAQIGWARLAGDIAVANIEIEWQVDGAVPEPFGVLVETTEGTHQITSTDSFLVDSLTGKAVIKVKGTIAAHAEKAWVFTITPDPRAKFPLPPSDVTVAVKGPPAVSVKAILAAPEKLTPKNGYSWFLAKGASWELKPAIDTELDPSATDGLLLQLSAVPSTATVPADSLSPAGQSAKIGLEFPDTGYFRPSTIALEASFQPVPETTSVVPEPIRLAATRESKALLMVAICLGGLICLLLAIGIFKAFSTRTGKQARVLPGC